MNTADFLKEKIENLEKEITSIKQNLKTKTTILKQLKNDYENISPNINYSSQFTSDEITRYSRQMLVPSIGCEGQLKLKQAKVLVVGIGGLGCPVTLYLAAAGVGEITIIDNDEVELSNLHRQILHNEESIGCPKTESAYHFINRLNNEVKIIPIHRHVNGTSLEEILSSDEYNVVVDGSDNVATRYLLNDACVMYKIPLVSGSALQMEGQLTVYNYLNGPCYRCLFPIPPPAESVTSCGDGGVLGMVPGVIGVLQSLEVIKILLEQTTGVLSGRLLTFDASNTTFRNIKLRTKNTACDVCGENPSINKLIDYELFCRSNAHDKVVNIDILETNEHVEPKDLALTLVSEKRYLLIDVRPAQEFAMCSLKDSINIPFSEIQKISCFEKFGQVLSKANEQVYVICRRGNDSQRAIAILKEKFRNYPVKYINVKGGLHGYAEQVDSKFPVY